MMAFLNGTVLVALAKQPTPYVIDFLHDSVVVGQYWDFWLRTRTGWALIGLIGLAIMPVFPVAGELLYVLTLLYNLWIAAHGATFLFVSTETTNAKQRDQLLQQLYLIRPTALMTNLFKSMEPYRAPNRRPWAPSRSHSATFHRLPHRRRHRRPLIHRLQMASISIHFRNGDFIVLGCSLEMANLAYNAIVSTVDDFVVLGVLQLASVRDPPGGCNRGRRGPERYVDDLLELCCGEVHRDTVQDSSAACRASPGSRAAGNAARRPGSDRARGAGSPRPGIPERERPYCGLRGTPG